MKRHLNPSFLVRNRLGTYYFQRRVPERFRSRTPTLPIFVRLSLHTKSISLAKKLARLLAAMWDQRAQTYFRSEEDYHRGMKLLEEYLSIASTNGSFEEVTKFFDRLDDTSDYESHLLQRARSYYFSKKLDSGIDPYANSLGRSAEAPVQLSASQENSRNASVRTETFLSDAHNDYIIASRNQWKSESDTERMHVDTFKLFLEITGNLKTSELQKSHTSDFMKVLINYPSNKNKKQLYKDAAPREFLTKGIPESDKFSPSTIKKYLTTLGSFLRWLKLHDLTAIDLDAPLTTYRPQLQRAADQREDFTCDEIRKLFNSKQYRSGLHKTSSEFWVPLIALYTGARLNEICQLSSDDIYEIKEFNCYVFDFNENSDIFNKTLKRSNHKRLVPVHRRLIQLGLLEYLDAVKKFSRHLFPEIEYRGVSNKYGDAFQKWFNRTYLNKNNCNISNPKVTFHSLRHTVITQFSVTHKLTGNQVSAGLGQAPKGGVFDTRYSKQHKFEHYYKYFELLDFDKCYNHELIRPWKYHAFWTNQTSKIKISK